MTSSPSPSKENQCNDVVTNAANFSKNKDFSSEHLEDEEEEDEEGDVDFNPFLKEALSLEGSSSLGSEIEEFDANVVDSGENIEHVMQATESLAGACKESNNTTLCEKENEPDIVTNTVTDADDEDAICRRTRARYSLASSTLDELETFLQETDDEDDLYNIDDEEEYRKFLTAVLQGGDASSSAVQENENVDEEDEDNDADFELELEEALGSDEEQDRRPETRQKKRQKTDIRQKRFSGQSKRPLRPLLPYAPIAPSDITARNYLIESTYTSSYTKNDYISAFTPQQIGQLHCLMYEHVQLLVQVFSLSVLEPSRQHIAAQVQGLLSEMINKRDNVLTSQRVPYPSFCFDPAYIFSTVTIELPKNLQTQNTSESATVDAERGFSSVPPFDPSHVQPMESFFWVPFVSGTVLSVMDVAPLNLVGSYMDDVSIAVQEHHRRRLEVTYDSSVDKECLFPFKSSHSEAEPTDDAPAPTPAPSVEKSKKTIAAALVERSKKQSIALVPKEIAKLALRFFPLFNPALFPHKPPPISVANRVLFTDSEDGLLARGLMEYNTNWKEIQKNFLPCKTAHQIFVRQKNRSCSRAPENPIKAVRRMKTSPLTPEEKARVEEGLKVYKLDWMAVWKYMVPHRDPTLLARQWRTAVGNQKSYKGDEQTRAKRRLYESKRRKSKLAGSKVNGGVENREGWSTEEDVNPLPGIPRWKTSCDKENCSTDNPGGENNSGDEGGNNVEEAYVHEAFLSDWRPAPPSITSEPAVSNLQENRPVELFTQEQLTNTHLVNSHSVSARISRPSEPKFYIRPYRARRTDCPRLVKLAPDLPPVNLPPTVRIMSQSAFTKYQDEASSKLKENLKSGRSSSHPKTGDLDERNPVEKGDSDLQMHPLLFQDPEDGNLPYYPLNGSAGSSSSFDFFPNNPIPPQLNLNLFRYSHQAKHTLNFFNSLKSKELSSCVNFHPLLQRTDDGNGAALIPEPSADSLMTCQNSLNDNISLTATNLVPPTPNELDLDIRLSSSGRKENGVNVRDSGTMETQSNDLQNQHEEINVLDSGGRSLGARNDEIVMEQEELSDSEDEEMAESVEFECEEMTDSEGEGGSDSDHVENLQNEDVQDDCFPKVVVHEDDIDQDEARFQEPSKSDLIVSKSEPRSLLGLSLNPQPLAKSKLAVTRNCRNSKNTTLPRAQLDAATQVKKPRKRAQKLV